MDDALAVTNLVYVGTLAIGGALVAFLAVATIITLIIAGSGQAIASIVVRILRVVRHARQSAGAAEETRTVYTREAIVAKADAILAARRAAAEEKPAEQKPLAEKPAMPEPATAVVVPHVRPATSSHRPGPHTGTQPALAVGRAS